MVTLDEVMLRLSTLNHKRFVLSEVFDATYGGAEANVAAAMCNQWELLLSCDQAAALTE